MTHYSIVRIGHADNRRGCHRTFLASPIFRKIWASRLMSWRVQLAVQFERVAHLRFDALHICVSMEYGNRRRCGSTGNNQAVRQSCRLTHGRPALLVRQRQPVSIDRVERIHVEPCPREFAFARPGKHRSGIGERSHCSRYLALSLSDRTDAWRCAAREIIHSFRG